MSDLKQKFRTHPNGQSQRGAFLRSIEKQRMRETKKLESLIF